MVKEFRSNHKKISSPNRKIQKLINKSSHHNGNNVPETTDPNTILENINMTKDDKITFIQTVNEIVDNKLEMNSWKNLDILKVVNEIVDNKINMNYENKIDISKTINGIVETKINRDYESSVANYSLNQLLIHSNTKCIKLINCTNFISPKLFKKYLSKNFGFCYNQSTINQNSIDNTGGFQKYMSKKTDKFEIDFGTIIYNDEINSDKNLIDFSFCNYNIALNTPCLLIMEITVSSEVERLVNKIYQIVKNMLITLFVIEGIKKVKNETDKLLYQNFISLKDQKIIKELNFDFNLIPSYNLIINNGNCENASENFNKLLTK